MAALKLHILTNHNGGWQTKTIESEILEVLKGLLLVKWASDVLSDVLCWFLSRWNLTFVYCFITSLVKILKKDKSGPWDLLASWNQCRTIWITNSSMVKRKVIERDDGWNRTFGRYLQTYAIRTEHKLKITANICWSLGKLQMSARHACW